MSIELMSQVWKMTEVKGSDLLMLLALADHANDDGVCWPSIPRLAERARISDRQAQRVISRLTEAGHVEIITKGNGAGHATIYRLTLKGDKLTPLEPKKGDKLTPLKDDNVSSLEQKKGDICDKKGDICDKKGDIAMSPEPPIESPIEPPQQNNGSCRSRQTDTDYADLCLRYENEIGLLSQTIAEELSTLLEESPKDWIMDAFRQAAVQNKRTLSYVKGILRNWRRDGRGAEQSKNGANGHTNGYANHTAAVTIQVMEDDE